MNEDKLIEVNNRAQITNLRNYGFIQAGANGGNPATLKPYLDQIYAGNLIDEKVLLVRTPEQKEAIRQDISNLQELNIGIQNLIDKMKNSTLKKLYDKKTDYESKLEKYIDGGISDNNMGGTIEIFNKNKFIVTTFFLVMISIFIFFFYVAVVYKALFINPQDILTSINEGNWGISLLPHWYEIQEALSTNLMVIFAPFIFFGFGYAIHILLELESKFKYLYISLVIIVTFALDYLLADQIHNRVNQALEIIDSPPGDFKDIIIVLIMGFVVYIIWSIIFHNWMEELNKLNIPNRLRKIINSVQNEIDSIETKILSEQSELEKNNSKISEYNKLIDDVLIPISAIINSLSEFFQGWNLFVVGSGESKNLEESTLIFNHYLKSKGLDDYTIKQSEI